MKTVNLSTFPLAPRNKQSDKSHFGHTLIVGGSKGLTGAAILSANAATRSGSGLVTLVLPHGAENRLNRLLLEVMLRTLPSDGFSFDASAADKILKWIKSRHITACVLGPGLSVEKGAVMVAQKIIERASIPVVLDADGLNSFCGKNKKLKKHLPPLVLTPHKKEFERLFEETYPADLSKRISLAKKLSKLYRAVLVLKGPRTLVVGMSGVYINRTGNPGMAKGGSGDVLSGIIGAFISQGLDIFQAAAWGVYFHGKAGDLAARQKGEIGMIASDIVDFLPKVLR